MKRYACVDIGGTAIKFGVIGEDAEIIWKNDRKTEAHKGGSEIMKKVIEIIEGLEEKHTLSGIGISTAGMVDTEAGRIFYAAPTIPDYTGIEFKKVLEDRFKLPCEVENDVNCAGLAESRSGAGKDSKVTLMLTIGTGIGGCILIDGKVFHGYSNSACEVGHMHMMGSQFQRLGASSILTKKVAKQKQESEENWNGYHIFEAAKSGDAVCMQAIDEMVEVLGQGIANICYVINPQTVILGGGIMAQKAYLKDKLQVSLSKYLIKSVADQTKLRFAVHQNDAGMLGAFYHFMDKHS